MATSKAPVKAKVGRPRKVVSVVLAKPHPKVVEPALVAAAPKVAALAPKPIVQAPVIEAVSAPVIQPVAEKIAEVAKTTTEAVIKPITEKTVTQTKAALKIVPAATKKASNMVEQIKSAAQTAFTQGSTKAREALDKTVKSFEEAGEFAKGNVEALMASGKAATAGVETLAQTAADYSKKSFEAGSAHLQTLATTRTPADAFKLQSDFAKSQFDGLVAEMSKSTEMMMKIMGSVFEPLSNRVALAAEKAKTVVAVAR